AVVVDPAVGAVVVAEAELQAKLLARVEVAPARLHGALAVVRVDALDPAEAALPFRRAAGELGPAAVEVGPAVLGIGDPDEHRRAVGEGAEAELALVEGGLGTLPLGDVPRDLRGPDDPAGRVPHGREH